MEVDKNCLIVASTSGGPMFPQPVVVYAVLTMEVLLDKLTSDKCASKFYASAKQKGVLVGVTASATEGTEDLDTRENGHLPQLVVNYLFSGTANTLLNNFCKLHNNKLNESKAAKGKLKTLQA